MNNRNQEIAISLLKLVENDFKVREKLAESGELYQGYHPAMESVHHHNADYLEQVIQEIGWPTVDKVGQDAAYAGWIILQHAITKPSLLRKTLPLLEELANQNKIYPREVAMLHDKICFFEMKPQKYGTQFDYNENNELVPWKIENPNQVDELRSQVGLPPLAEATEYMQNLDKKENQQPTLSYIERMKSREKWAKEVGWIKY